MILDYDLVISALVIIPEVVAVNGRSFYFRSSEPEEVDFLVIPDFDLLIVGQSL
jgi:hypothetical protein